MSKLNKIINSVIKDMSKTIRITDYERYIIKKVVRKSIAWILYYTIINHFRPKDRI